MSDKDTTTEFDTVVVGAGFGGIHMPPKLRDELGLTVRGFGRAAGIGGTWYWNRYLRRREPDDSSHVCATRRAEGGARRA
jgi:cation diffusion facilitator CzcD-associated flavoprotein CzcO